VLRAFRDHLEATAAAAAASAVAAPPHADAPLNAEAARGAAVRRRPFTWWEVVLTAMPAWHTSPFSEYAAYYGFATAHFPETVREPERR